MTVPDAIRKLLDETPRVTPEQLEALRKAGEEFSRLESIGICPICYEAILECKCDDLDAQAKC